jgi:hypothetical protein
MTTSRRACSGCRERPAERNSRPIFYTIQIPVSLWLLANNKANGRGQEGRALRDSQGEVVFIDARELGYMRTRTERDLTPEDRARIVGVYHRWRGDSSDAAANAAEPGFCKSWAMASDRQAAEMQTCTGEEPPMLDHMTCPFPVGNSFQQALILADQWHRPQYRKVAPGEPETIPYISHVLGVASVALEFGATENEAIAALLHDALEDGPKNTGRDAADLRAEIVRAFGEAGEVIAKLVDDATDAMPKAGEEKAPWPRRKTEYLDKLPYKAAASLLVSASDKLHNARTILTDVLTRPVTEREAYFGRFNQGQMGTLQYYRRLADTYLAVQTEDVTQRPRLQALFAELERTVAALETACGLSADQTRQHPLLRAVPSGSVLT